MNTPTRFLIPRATRAKAVSHVVKQCGAYALREINGMTGECVRTVERKRFVNGLTVSFWRFPSGNTSGLVFERVI